MSIESKGYRARPEHLALGHPEKEFADFSAEEKEQS